MAGLGRQAVRNPVAHAFPVQDAVADQIPISLAEIHAFSVEEPGSDTIAKPEPGPDSHTDTLEDSKPSSYSLADSESSLDAVPVAKPVTFAFADMESSHDTVAVAHPITVVLADTESK